MFSAALSFVQRLRQQGLGRNMAMAVAQAATGIIALFASYKVLVSWHGASALGLWSLIIAFTLSIRMLDPSGGAGVGRFIAVAVRREADTRSGAGPKPADYADTSLIMMTLFYIVLILAAWYPLTMLMRWQINDSGQLEDALNLLPMMLGLVIIMTIGTSSADTLDGLNRADLRAIVMIASYVIFLAMVIMLVPRWGLTGMAYAQLSQYTLIALVSRVLAQSKMAGLSMLPTRFERVAAKEMIGYGMKLQAGAFANFLTDPLVRILLNHFGSLTVVGMYELANKFVFQIRAIVVTGAMPLIPALAVMNVAKADDLNKVKRFNKANLKLSLFIFLVSVFGSFFISYIVIGKIEIQVIAFCIILAFGYSINTISLIMYIYMQSQNKLFGNIIGQFSIGFVTLSLSYPLYYIFGIEAIVLSYAIGLSIAGIVFIYYAAKKEDIKFFSLW